MNITEVSTQLLQTDGVYSAHILLNDRLTSSCCMHNHQSERTAAKCCKMMQQRWDAIAASTHDVACVDWSGVYQVTWQEAWYGSDQPRTVTTRFRYIND
jgi:hypothetical protein